jgi:hypothetical protein
MSPTAFTRATLAWWRARFTKPCGCPPLDVRIERVASSHLLECGVTRGAGPLSSKRGGTGSDDRMSSRIDCGRCGVEVIVNGGDEHPRSEARS